MPEKLVSVTRLWLPVEHQQLRQNMPKIDRELPNHSVKWRRLGQAAVSLLERQEYERYAIKRQSKLFSKGADAVAGTFNSAFKEDSDTWCPSTIEAYDTEFFGKGQYVSIAYLLDPVELSAQRDRLQHLLDSESGVNGTLLEFDPHLTVATVPFSDSSETLRLAFENFRPSTVTLAAPTARAA